MRLPAGSRNVETHVPLGIRRLDNVATVRDDSLDNLIDALDVNERHQAGLARHLALRVPSAAQGATAIVSGLVASRWG